MFLYLEIFTTTYVVFGLKFQHMDMYIYIERERETEREKERERYCIYCKTPYGKSTGIKTIFR